MNVPSETLQISTAFTRYKSLCKNFVIDTTTLNALIKCGRVGEAVQLTQLIGELLKSAEVLNEQIIHLPEPGLELPALKFIRTK